MKSWSAFVAATAALAATATIGFAQFSPMGDAFTYQARLTDAGSPANGVYDLRFEIYDEETEGSQIGETVIVEDVEVIAGMFTVVMDCGSDVYVGEARWMEIGVRPGDSSDPFVILEPRQELTPTPHAVYAESAGSAVGGITGTGTTNHLAKFTSAGTIGESTLTELPPYVGIGTDTPAMRLDIRGTLPEATDARLRLDAEWNPEIFMDLGSQGADGKIRFLVNATDKWAFQYKGARDSLEFLRTGTGHIMSLKPDGRVGIGTMHPGESLVAVGGVRAAYDVDQTEYLEMAHGGGNAFLNWLGDGNLAFRYDDLTLATLTQDGNLGIGTTVPGGYARLHIHTTDTAVFKMTNEGTGQGYNDGPALFSFQSTNSLTAVLLNRENAPLWFGTNNTERMRIAPDGKVGIGTNSPAYQLDVTGDIRATGLLRGTATMAQNSDKLDGYHAGNASGQVPVSNTQRSVDLNADMLDGLHGESFARDTRFFIPGGGGTTLFPIPHHRAFTVTVAEAAATPTEVAFVHCVENDGFIAWQGFDGAGIQVRGSASLSTNTTILTLRGGNIKLLTPGSMTNQLKVTSISEDVQGMLVWPG